MAAPLVPKNVDGSVCSVEPDKIVVELTVGKPGMEMVARDRVFVGARVGETVAEEVEELKVKEKEV